MNPIYLDHNATTPVLPEVAEFMRPYLKDYFGNPSSSHRFGMETKKAIEEARRKVAQLLNCRPEDVVFTSGGSEANNYAIKGLAYARRHEGNHIISSSIEHPAVTEVCKYLEKQGFEITWLTVDEYGMVNPQDLEKAIKPATILVSIMHANNEVGTIQPIGELAAIAHKHGIVFHSDGAQSAAKIKTDVQELGVDLFSLAGHKLYAPKGVGALYVKQGIQLEKLIHGADHEQNRRAGTENVLEIAGFGKACEIARRDLEKNMKAYREMRDALESGLTKRPGNLRVNGHPEMRLPNTSNISFPGIEANTLMDEMEEIAASAGAACHTGDVDVSPVLQAMQLLPQYAMGTVRFSVGKLNDMAQIHRSVEIIASTVERLQPETEKAGKAEPGTGKEIKLTHYTHGLGCACKLRPQDLEQVLKDLPIPTDPQILVGSNTADDAAVFRINEETALVQTLDFFTPVVDDPYAFGQVAAANALSDVYAMGAKPLFGLNIVGFPPKRLPLEVLEQILKGASDKTEEAGIYVLGGHTVEDTEPKFGMVITGTVHPGKVLSNNTIKAGDILILTKPIGLGIIATAVKRGIASKETAEKAMRIMAELNNKAAEVMLAFPVNACTDVTGFGLMGHLKEMLGDNKLEIHIAQKDVPIIPEAIEFAQAGIIPGGTVNNREFVKEVVEWDPSLSNTDQLLLCDAQTSGGLLISLPASEEKNILQQMHEASIEAACIGKVVEWNVGKIVVK